MSPTPRPKNLNLLSIRMPVTAVLSIGHRIAGFLMVLATPFTIYLLEKSLRSAEEFAQAQEILSSNLRWLMLLPLGWFALHHLLAGLRFLLLDLGIGEDKQSAQLSAWTVFAVGAVGLILLLVVVA